MKSGQKRNLSQSDKDTIIRAYETNRGSRKELQEGLGKLLNIHPRSVRKWAKKLGVGVMAKNIISPSKVMIYDLETSLVPALVFWTGKQYIGHNQLTEELKIITVSWKWLGEDEVYYLTWDKDHSDENLVKDFLKEYNKADMIIGYNNDRFDNRWFNARAMKYNLEVNTFVKSFDIMKEEKRVFRVPSYSMAYMSKYSNVALKQSHEGRIMWEKIQMGSSEEQKEYLQKMVDYNVGDIVATEELYIRLRKYFKHKVHFGVLHGGEKWQCPTSGSTEVEFERRTATPAGTIQVIMRSKVTGETYKITNKQYMSCLDYKIKNGDTKM